MINSVLNLKSAGIPWTNKVEGGSSTALDVGGFETKRRGPASE